MAKAGFMSLNAREFTAKLKAHVPSVAKPTLQNILVDVCFTAFESIVVGGTGFGNPTGTPVKSGWARRSWDVELGALTIQAQPRPEGAAGDPGGTTAMARIAAALAKAQLGVPVFLVGGADYLVVLEYGRRMGERGMMGSEQAPQGMIRLTTLDGQAMLDASARKLGVTR